MKKALITGITGQDGSYLAELLLEKGYEVHGIVRRVALESPETHLNRIKHILPKVKIHSGNIENYPRLIELAEEIRPDECYHLAAQSFVHESFEDAFSTIKTNIDGTLYVLSAIRAKCPGCRLYFAGSSEMFGKAEEIPQSESTRFHPRSPYGVTKVTGFEMTRNYRESYGLHFSSGILFNHESPRRGYEFVTRKITTSVARAKTGRENVIVLGNLDAKRDWGFAGDFVRAMWQMLQSDEPEDYVVSTDQTHSVREFLESACAVAEIGYELLDLTGETVEEADRILEDRRKDKDRIYVIQHPRFFRPAEVDYLIGDSTKARRELGWEPEVGFSELVEMMVRNDIRLLSRD